MTGFTERDVANQSGRCFLVTGANTGIGFEIARVLAARGARVLLGCRDKRRADEAIARLAGGNVAHLPLNLGDLTSVRAAAEQATAEPRLDGLICNAGVMFPPLTRTAEGRELQFGVNHIGHFALVGLLLGKLAQTPGARVVITSSMAHRRGRIAWDDIDATARYNRFTRYTDSKLANLLHLLELDRRLRAAGSPVIAAGCHPGIAATDLMRHLGPAGRLFTPLVGLVLNNAARGAWPALQAACDPTVRGGDYFGPDGFREVSGASAPAGRSAGARDGEAAARLWELSVELGGVDPGLPSAG